MANANLNDAHIVIGVTGGIAAYKAIELCRQFSDAGARVSVMMTENAQRFVGPLTFAAITHEPVRTSIWDAPEPNPHIALGQSADLILVAPATARFLGSFAHGIADDLVTLTAIASAAPVVVAPAMHEEMWTHDATQQNIGVLLQRGITIVPPGIGHLAGGDHGVGRLADLEAIVHAANTALRRSHLLQGVRVLVTAGGTREPIDPVRYLGNRSSGKQGHAIAHACSHRGANVTLVTTSEEFASPKIAVKKVETADEMQNAVLQALPNSDVVIMNAAVADFRPQEIQNRKIKKSEKAPIISLVPTIDILGEVAKLRRNDQLIIGFAAETHDVAHDAQDKLRRKQLDMIVANDVSTPGAGFAAENNHAQFFDATGLVHDTGLVAKHQVAEELADSIAAMLRRREQR